MGTICRADVLACLSDCVRRICGDPVDRRRLRYHPARTLAEFGIVAPWVPPELAVRHYTVSVTLTEPALFGVDDAVGPPILDDPPPDALLVAVGAKPMALVYGAEEHVTRVCRWAEARGLCALLTPFEFDVEREPGKGLFADRAVNRRPARHGSGASRGAIVGGDANHAMLGWLSLLFGWDGVLGRALGYPACCVDFFAAVWERVYRDPCGDVCLTYFETSPVLTEVPWELNTFARYLGVALVQHFPCALDCPSALTVARRHLAALRMFAPAFAERCERILAAPLLHGDEAGVAALVGADVRHAPLRIDYDPRAVRASDDASVLASRLRAGAHLTLSERDATVLVDGEVLPARLVLFTNPNGAAAEAHGEIRQSA